MSSDAPALLSLEEASTRLLSPGSPFELTEEASTLGQRGRTQASGSFTS